MVQSYDVLVDVLKSHFPPKKLVVKRSQMPGESIAGFQVVVELWQTHVNLESF